MYRRCLGQSCDLAILMLEGLLDVVYLEATQNRPETPDRASKMAEGCARYLVRFF